MIINLLHIFEIENSTFEGVSYMLVLLKPVMCVATAVLGVLPCYLFSLRYKG